LKKTKHENLLGPMQQLAAANFSGKLSALLVMLSNRSLRVGNTVQLLDSKIDNSQSSWWIELKFSGKVH